MEDVSKAQHSEVKDLVIGIKNNKNHQIKLEHYIPLINNLEIRIIFKSSIKSVCCPKSI